MLPLCLDFDKVQSEQRRLINLNNNNNNKPTGKLLIQARKLVHHDDRKFIKLQPV